ncbi:MAG: leucyl/phenylalanyl-tRNA--protein transferase [Hyphomicrobiaceae bacterium]|nr:leucyl/phenylalanyl-tRNA--protein transferase [Hyphomicrobiaceae bacterium]
MDKQPDRELPIYTCNEIGDLTTDILLDAYKNGSFPMGEDANDETLYWIEPTERGIIPLDGFHLSKSLKRVILRETFEVRINSDFNAVIEGCSSPRAGRISTWINAPIRTLYRQLFEQGNCHTVEVWRDNQLAGGLYGVHIGGAFFGESMFSFERDASKVALANLVARLNHCGFTLLDTQFITDHLRSLGGVEIGQLVYRKQLQEALKKPADFLTAPLDLSPHKVLQLVNQTSNTGCSTP